MAKSDHSSEIKALQWAINVIPRYRLNREEIAPGDQAILGKAFGIYKSYSEPLLQINDPRITDVQSFVHFIDLEAELGRIIDKLTEIDNAPEIQKAPEKEVSTIPSNLETLVAQYEEFQNEKFENDGSSKSVAEAVKRARKSWQTRNQAEQIRQNRARLQADPEKYLAAEEKLSDSFFTQNVDPKSENRQKILSNIQYVARQAVTAQAVNLGLTLTPAQVSQAVDDITYLGLSGAVDISQTINLNVVSQLAFRNLQGVTFVSPINDVDAAVQKTNESLENNPYSDDPEKGEKELQEILDKNGDQTERYFKTSNKIFSSKLRQQDLDLDTKAEAASKTLNSIHEKLSGAIPNARLPETPATPLERHASELENAIRQTDPHTAGIAGSTLRINPDGLGVRAEAVVKTTGSQNRELSPEALHFYSMGLTTEKMANLEKYAQANPQSAIGQLYTKQKDVFDQVRYQLGKIQSSKLGQEISDKLKPLSNAAQSITNTYNKLASPLQKITKFAVNPTGAISGFINKQIGQYIGNQLIKQTSSALAKELGGYILEKGLGQGVKSFLTDQAAKLALKLAGKAAVAAGTEVAAGGALASLSALLGVSTGGLSLIVEAVVFAVFEGAKFLYNKAQQLAEAIYGEKISGKEIAAVAAIGVGTATAAIVGFFAALRLAAIATRAAFISALTVILIACIVLAFFLGLIFLTAPMLSTFVQLDAVEKVNYTVIHHIVNGCANTQGVFVFQANPAWKNVACSKCDTGPAGFCKIGPSGCGSASMTMILNAFGANTGVVDVWNNQHSLGGYVYDVITPPYRNCMTDNNRSLLVLKNAGLTVTEIAQPEISNVLSSCGLVLAATQVNVGGHWYGHILVIIGINGNQVTTLDPGRSDGDGFVHNVGSDLQLVRLWSVVP